MNYKFILYMLHVACASPWYPYPYNATKWGKIAEICVDGKMQSPIALPIHPGDKQNEISTMLGMTANLTASHWDYLEWYLNTENKPTIQFNGLNYELQSFHCHTGSEHTVDGYQYPAECHFKLSRNLGSEWAVIGLFLDDDATDTNSAFSWLLDDLPAAKDWNETNLTINFDWTTIISGLNLEQYWSYNGSLTTPNCDENKQWIVLEGAVQVTPSQIQQIKNKSGRNNNFRPPMPLYGRVVKDGSEIVNASVTWIVKACCLKAGVIPEKMTSSVVKVIGLSVADIQITSFSTKVDSVHIKYKITLIENTQTFLTDLLQNLNEEEYMEDVKDQMQVELKSVALSIFETVSVGVDKTGSQRSYTLWAVLISLFSILAIFLMAVGVKMTMKKLKVRGANDLLYFHPHLQLIDQQ